MSAQLLLSIGGAAAAVLGLVYLVVLLRRTALELTAATKRATILEQANLDLAELLSRTQAALEGKTKYAKLLEKKVVETADVAGLASVLNELFRDKAAPGGDGAK